MKNNQKEIINISSLNKNIVKEKSKINDNKNNIINISEDKNYKKESLPKISLKKDNNHLNNNNNIMLNQKSERTQSNNNKEAEEEINNNIEDKNLNNNNNISRKRTTVAEAKKEMKDFELLIINTEKELQNKYGLVFPDLSFEDNLPDDIKNKLIDDFLENPKIKKILTMTVNTKISN